MSIFQLIYASTPFGFDEGTLAALLIVSRRNNARDGVTGALICRGDLYLQLLEGPQEMVERAFQRIEWDRRHLDVKVLSRRNVTKDVSRESLVRDRVSHDESLRLESLQTWSRSKQV